MNVNLKILFFYVFVFTSSGCNTNSGIYDNCFEAPLTGSEKKLKQEFADKHKFGVFITRTNLKRIGSKALCENMEKSYCISLLKFDSLYSEKETVDMASKLANRIYNEIFSDTMKCIVEKIEISFEYVIENKPDAEKRIEEIYCFHFTKKSLEEFFGESCNLIGGKITKKKIKKSGKLNFINGDCFYLN